MKLFNKITLLVIFLAPVLAHAQADSLSLANQFKTMVDNAETYQSYRLIRIGDLNAFNKKIKDSVALMNEAKQVAAQRNSSLDVKIDTLNVQLAETSRKLNISESKNEQISFLGIPFTKTAYNIMVWAIIIVLAVIAVVLFVTMSQRNAETKRAKKELKIVEDELSEQKDSAREKQLKLKRELQTAINALEEKKGFNR